jgi:hypothetical protein
MSVSFDVDRVRTRRSSATIRRRWRSTDHARAFVQPLGQGAAAQRVVGVTRCVTSAPKERCDCGSPRQQIRPFDSTECGSCLFEPSLPSQGLLRQILTNYHSAAVPVTEFVAFSNAEDRAKGSTAGIHTESRILSLIVPEDRYANHEEWVYRGFMRLN